MADRLSTMPTTSRIWSCGTLSDGLQYVSSEARELEEMERELERQLEAVPGKLIYVRRNILQQISGTIYKKVKQLCMLARPIYIYTRT